MVNLPADSSLDDYTRLLGYSWLDAAEEDNPTKEEKVVAMSKLISELLDLPPRVRKGDFVLNLSKGVTEPKKTLERYVATPQLVECFNDSLSLIKTAVDANNSKATYLHGSFGSGKSHFMAVLHLILRHNSVVRTVKELQPVCDDHQWVR